MPGTLAPTEIRVAQGGTVYIAPSGTAGPANMAAAWTGFTNLGYVSDEGSTINRSMETETVMAWQTISATRYIITGVGLTAAFSALQVNKDTLSAYFGGGSVTNQGSGSFLYNISSAPTVDERVFGLEWTDGSLIYRFVMGRSMCTETGEFTVGRSGAIQLPMTWSAMAPTSGTVLGYLLTNDASAMT
jgi:hypothetical protein